MQVRSVRDMMRHMVTTEYVRDRILAALPGATVTVHDDTGTGDHFSAIVVSDAFSGRSRVEQHKLVYAALDGDLGDHAIHALALSTRVPNESDTVGKGS